MKLYEKGMKKLQRAQRVTSTVQGQEHMTSEGGAAGAWLVKPGGEQRRRKGSACSLQLHNVWWEGRQSQTLLGGARGKDKGSGQKLQQGKFHFYV